MTPALAMENAIRIMYLDPWLAESTPLDQNGVL
jgi:hypothetical protein